MDTNKILKSDYLDLLFEGRNKKYGGYELRRNYERRMRKALLTLFTVTAVFSVYTVVANSAAKTVTDIKPIVHVHELEDLRPPIPPTPPPPPPPPPVRPVVDWAAPKIVEDKEVPEDEKLPEVNQLAKVDVGTQTIDGDSSAPATITTAVVSVPSKKAEIPMWVEQMPEAPYDVNAYLSKHIEYPPYARENNIGGRIAVQFVVNEDGNISDVKIVGKNRHGGGLEEEAMRVVSGLPKWKPGRQNGNPVKVYYTLPVTFMLQ